MNNIPLSFELPRPTPAKPAHHSRASSADHQPSTPGQHTDLPLPLCGNGGSSRRAADTAEVATLEELLERLERMLAVPMAPPLASSDHREVRRWAEQAAAGMVSRREGLKLVRQIERVLADECRTFRQIVCARERIEQRRALAAERVAGTHWQRRDSGRRAKQPTHVDVDPTAWRRAKAAAARKGMTIGHYVGALVRSAAERDFPAVGAYASTTHLFARIDVDRPTWEAYKARCYDRGVSAARGVGLVVEASIKDRG